LDYSNTRSPLESSAEDESPVQSETLPSQPVADGESPPSWQGLRRFLLDIGETLLLSFVLFAIVNFVSARIRVEGYSMEPTFHDGELVIVNKLAYTYAKPQRGDVIIFYYPRDPKEEYIKRIIGLPGDEVFVQDGKVTVNGETLTEPYIADSPAYSLKQTVPEGTLFVLGDNRNNSSDSHNWGPLPMDLVVGKAVFIYWPPQNMTVVEHFKISRGI
jgi:signal peptidase I